MTRATLLHVLDNTSALGPAEVRELEQLAQAFPYCQTAHLLLAKAAHDQGTMLAGQRLRRAATYAADRTLLRRLIEHVEPAKPAAEPAVHQEMPAAPVAIVPVTPLPMEPEAPVAPVAAKAVAPLALPATEAPTAEAEATPVSDLASSASQVEPFPEPAPEPAHAPEETPTLTPEEATPLTEETPKTEEAPVLAEAGLALLLDVEGVDIPAADAPAEDYPEIEPELEVAEDLPAQAPAVRPPVEVGDARFEFGLADAPPPAAPAYELPGLVDEWAASAVTLSLGSLEPLSEGFGAANAGALAAPVLTPAAFTGDDTVGYGFGESSRLGFSMQLLSLLTDKAETAEEHSAKIAAAQPPAAPLPPAGAFFEPDPLLLDHWATHRPPTPTLPSSLDLINNFLRRQPRLTRPAMLPPAATTQADLSVRSTRAESDLASESLARILVRQGKTARAIEIYEKLMVKQPEKMAYFAAQIQQLQPSA